MRKVLILIALLGMGTLTSFAQTQDAEEISLDKSFEDAGTPANENVVFHLAPKFCKAGELVPEQPIALSSAKKQALELAKAKPTQLHKDCLNIIYTVDPIYSEGTITGAVKGTIVIKWDKKRKIWVFSYLRYQLLNIEQNTYIFKPEAL